MLRIERSANGQVVFTLSGRMQTEDIEQFQQLLVVETPGQQLMFNLRDVTLVDQDVGTGDAEYRKEIRSEVWEAARLPRDVAGHSRRRYPTRFRVRILKFPTEP
jgi:hypothetical protein